ncbi:carbohydrate kinase [Shewanella sp. SG41-4]|uniref:carbohydrate kinase family protein n=1 Tax=Shewanella sp. SG41-4 TaxID=2760976 RepID=UPI0015FFBA0B|nr:carbohydrate kinase [Shewanella sp. SG41-4]MBB1437629.1 carbohydrate kinase [Shewanella sp. SG41-4]
MSTLLSFGEVLIDLLPVGHSGLVHEPIPGGAPANVAVGYAKLGGKSFFAGGISADNYGVMLQDALAAQGVDVSCLTLVPDAATATVLVSLDAQGERSFSFNRQNTADMLYREVDFDAIDWSKIDIFHLCSNTFTEKAIFNASLYGAKKAHKEQTLVSFDVNLRLSLWQDTRLLSARVEQCFGYTHLLKMSKEEALYLAQERGGSFDDYLAFCIAQGVRLILVTNGAESVLCHSVEFSFELPVPKIVAIDTTAAGDSFVAGFLFELGRDEGYFTPGPLVQKLLNRVNVQTAAEFAIKCGAITCTAKGAFPALPVLAQVQS